MHSDFYTLHYPFLSAKSDLYRVFLKSKKFAQQKLHGCYTGSAHSNHYQILLKYCMKNKLVERYRLDCWCFIGFIALVSIVSVL